MSDIVYNKNGVPFDIDAIATDLNGKMDRDCLNRSDVGGGVMANMAMPDYAAGEDRSWDTSYREDVDGYAWARGTGTNSSSCFEIQISFDNTNWTIIANVYAGNAVGPNACCITPIPKGVYWRAHGGAGAQPACKFYPCKGANQ